MGESTSKLGKYRHYKTQNLYQVIGFAVHSETLEEMIIYKALYPTFLVQINNFF
ncbi:MAG: DUF1653 domain-containing protein [Gammaproteobacteria bacterium]